MISYLGIDCMFADACLEVFVTTGRRLSITSRQRITFCAVVRLIPKSLIVSFLDDTGTSDYALLEEKCLNASSVSFFRLKCHQSNPCWLASLEETNKHATQRVRRKDGHEIGRLVNQAPVAYCGLFNKQTNGADYQNNYHEAPPTKVLRQNKSTRSDH